MENEKLSIIVPVYNLESYIGKCVESLLTQSYSDIEVILVDDGSTDRSWNILQELSEKDERLVIVHQENGRTARARNTGLKYVTGKYVTFVDGDDSVSKDAFQRNIACLESNPTLDWISFSVIRVNDEMEELSQSKTFNHFIIQKDEIIEKHNFLRKFYFKELSGLCCGTIYRFNAVRDILFPVNEYYEDSFYFCEALCKTRKGMLSTTGKYLYLERGNSAQFASLDKAHLRSTYNLAQCKLSQFSVLFPNDLNILHNIEDDYYYGFKLYDSKSIEGAKYYYKSFCENHVVPHNRRCFLEFKIWIYNSFGYSRLKRILDYFLT